MHSQTKLSRQQSEIDFAPLDYFEIKFLDRWVEIKLGAHSSGVVTERCEGIFRSNREMHKSEIIIRNLDKTMELSRQSFLVIAFAFKR